MKSTEPTPKRNFRPLPLLLGFAAAALLFGGGYYLGLQSSQGAPGGAAASAPPERTTSGPLSEMARRDPNDPFALGSVDAPVAMVVYSDYRCPFCARYSTISQPEIVEKYVNEGLVRLEWRDFPVFGEASLLAARAGRAAAAQGLFWEFNDAIYAAAPQNGHHNLTHEKLQAFAEQVGVPDLERFSRDMNSGDFDGAIALDSNQARSLGITGTPSFVIDGNPVVGAQPTELFEQIIEGALTSKQN